MNRNEVRCAEREMVVVGREEVEKGVGKREGGKN